MLHVEVSRDASGNCNACVDERAVFNISIGEHHYPFVLRLCDKCAQELLQRLTEELHKTAE